MKQLHIHNEYFLTLRLTADYSVPPSPSLVLTILIFQPICLLIIIIMIVINDIPIQ